MNRIGFKNTKDLLEAYKLIDKKNVIHYGIFSHIFDNDRLISMKTQFERFEGLMKAIPN
jgi:alanine racemase